MVRMPKPTEGEPDAIDFIPVSAVLKKLHDEAPSGYFTLDWLMSKLQKQSFGLLMLVLAVITAAPGICLIGGLLLLIPAFQMIMAATLQRFRTGSALVAFPPGILGRSSSAPFRCLNISKKQSIHEAAFQ